MKIIRIKLIHQKDFNNYLKDETINVSIIAETSDLGDVNITGYNELNLFSLDQDNFYLIPNSNDGVKADFLARTEGSGIIKASFFYNNETFYTSKQFLCHGSFFKDNYLQYLIPTLDAQNIQSNQFLKSILDTLMEMIDILYGYNEDLKIISNFKYGKSKFISLLAQNVGFERIDFTQFNSKYEWSNNETFRELVANMFDLVSVRGTKLTYDLFFNALGYITTLQEFWYDSDGNLIEINSEDESLSTFYAYSADGSLIDNPPYPRPDPRKNNNLLSNNYNSNSNYIKVLNSNGNISYKNKSDLTWIVDKTNNYDVNVFKNNKTNYVRIIFNNSINDNVFQDPQKISLEKKILIKRYLEFLRPSHIQYILETFQEDIPVDTFDVASILGEQLGISILNEFKDYLVDEIANIVDTDFNIGDVKGLLEELSFFNKWDTLLKFDESNVYDFKNLLIEDFIVESI